jgi:uncharacterized protein YegP (UPF0339 family)
MVTSTRFSGGDWHWRLLDADAAVLIEVGGYSDERACREAIDLLRGHAGAALFPAER